MAATVAVITPTHQRRKSLQRVLDGLARQSCPPDFFTVVVVCDGCTDGTTEMLHEAHYAFPLQVIEQRPAAGPAAARNQALKALDSPIVLFLDDDVIPCPDLIALHAGGHAAQPNLVVIGPLLAPPGRQQPWIRWEAETLRNQYEAMQGGLWEPTPRQFYTGNASVRLEHIIAAGGFDLRFRRGEDVDLAFRLQRNGLRFVFEPKAGGTHIAYRTFQSWAAAAHEYGRVEATMGPVWDGRRLVDIKALEFRRRNAIVRQLVQFGLTHGRYAEALVAWCRVAGRALAAVGLWRLARGAYTAIFELQYWRGVDEATAQAR